MIVGAGNEETEAGVMPSQELVDAMMEYNESLVKAGVLLAAEGLYPSSHGARIAYKSGKATVLDGPFTEAKELIAGFWLIQVKSREEALEWAMRLPVPCDHDGIGLHVWQVFDPTDMPPESMSPETAERERALRESLEDRDPA
ncbi:YciI family protein [Nonomuraea sp. NPDC048916]|uniref:YciI family protein n=1 Tax=Nonomuraea sp. NPDC048916 TaxID=3154232 RepID=UPI0033E4AA62